MLKNNFTKFREKQLANIPVFTEINMIQTNLNKRV